VSRAQKIVLGVGPIQLEPDEEHDAGRLQLQDPGSLELVLHREDGVPLPKESSIIVLDALGYAAFANNKDGDRFKISALIPGTHRLFCTIEGVATVMRSFEIRSRETTQLEWTVPPGTLREFEFDAPDDGPTPQRIRFVVGNAAEVLIDMVSYRSPPASGRGASSVMALAQSPRCWEPRAPCPQRVRGGDLNRQRTDPCLERTR
jgi:hypothetical protein